MRKIYHLATCSTNQRIIKELNLTKTNLEFQDIKTEPISISQLEEMKKRSGSYEALFSRNAMKYRSLGLGQKTLTEHDYRNYILEEYTFLKRPVVILDDKIFVGNSKSNVKALEMALANE